MNKMSDGKISVYITGGILLTLALLAALVIGIWYVAETLDHNLHGHHKPNIEKCEKKQP